MKKIIALSIGLVLVVAACGAEGGTADDTTKPPVTTTAQPAPPSSTTTATQPATTTTQPGTTTTEPHEMTQISVYFFMDDVGPTSRPGPFLVPVSRQVPKTQLVAAAAIRELIAGPTQAERNSQPAITSAIPADTLLLGITIEEGNATIDLSREFEAGGGSFSMFGRLAQVIYTVTQFPTIDRVTFHLDGEPISVFSSEGILLDAPVGRDDYLDMVPTILVDDPAYGGTLGNPARLVGIAAVFEAVFQAAIVDDDGRILVETPVMTDQGQGWGHFDVTIPYEVDRAQRGAVIAWVFSAKDGSQIDVREYPVLLTPGP